jgi:hypothetical protein
MLMLIYLEVNTESLLHSTRMAGLEVNTEKIKCIFMSYPQNVTQNFTRQTEILWKFDSIQIFGHKIAFTKKLRAD